VLGPGGMLQAILQVMLRGAGLVGFYSKVLEGVLLTGRFVPRSWILVTGGLFLSVLFLDIFFLDFRSWTFYSWAFSS
jgi:hypothetical protein